MSGTTTSTRPTTLIHGESDRYIRILDGVIVLTILNIFLSGLALVGVVTVGASGLALTRIVGGLFVALLGAIGTIGLAARLGVIPVPSRRLRGLGLMSIPVVGAVAAIVTFFEVRLSALLGTLLLVTAVGIGGAGLSSRLGSIETAPNATGGGIAGIGIGLVGGLAGAIIGGTIWGPQSGTWVIAAVVFGGSLTLLTIFTREDIGSTIPPALVVGGIGTLLATAAIYPGWQWVPQQLSGGFTAGIVIPLLVFFTGVLSLWAAGKCRAGFGPQGREYGAILMVNLIAIIALVVMVAIVGFVTARGAGYAFHGLTVSALTALLGLLPLAIIAAHIARQPGTGRGIGIRRALQVLPLAGVGAVATFLLSQLIRGSTLTYAYTYTVYQDRDPQPLDTAVTITAEPTVGAVAVLVIGGLLTAYCYRQYGSLRGTGTRPAWLPTARRGVIGLGGVLLLVFVIGVSLVESILTTPIVALVLSGVVVVGALATAGLLMLPIARILGGTHPRIAELVDQAPVITFGLFGGSGVFVMTVLAAGATGVEPAVGPVAIVPLVALIGIVSCLGLAVVITLARRDRPGDADQSLTDERWLALTGAVGFGTGTGLYVWATGHAITVGSFVLSPSGTFSWPMAMTGYIPLGTSPGGIMPAVVGTIWLVLGATLFAVPLGVGAAVFLTEYAEQGRFTNLVEIATNSLWSTPSVVFGLFGAAFLIPRLGEDTSLLAGMLVLGFMLLPLMLITSREAIKAVPEGYRDASAALGVTRWQTIRSVVLPASMPGIITGGILGVGRIAGETAPLILVLGSPLNAINPVRVLRGFEFIAQPPFIVNEQLLTSSAALPTQVWAIITAGVSGSPARGWASAFLLLVVVLTFYTIGITARTYFRRKINYE